MQARLGMIVLGLLVGLATFGPGPARAEETVENGVNRPGGDYKNFEMEPTIAGFTPCQSACTHDPSCRAWTYVVAGVQGPKPHCWLKNTVPPAFNDKCCVSGVSGVVAGLEFGTNRPGSDYRSFDIGNADLRDQPELLCKTACDSEAQCRSWTYVKPGIQGPNARCWLKSAVPGAQANNCCISGLRTAPGGGTAGGAGTVNQGLDLDPNGKSTQQCQEAFGRNKAVCDLSGNPASMSSCYQQIQAALAACVSLAASKAGGTTGGGTATASVPPEWAEMLKAHNDFRKQHCSPPLQWDAALATAAQKYAETCNLGVHGAPNENLATALSFRTSNGVTTDVVPASSDSTAFTNTWACEEPFYPYSSPKICSGFKNACNEPKPECGGNPVTGHYVQVVWKSATKVGCGRAVCNMKDKDGKTHQGTNWVCRYDIGTNDAADVLRQNVMPLGCKP